MSETILTIILSSLLGAAVRFSLTYADQRWAATYHFTLTCMLLPPITFVVTKLISGNIALSLGMVGALSIVRFRNPVKSSLELTIYFLLITIGIACSVFYKWGIFLTGFCIFCIISLNIIRNRFNKSQIISNLSFDEGERNFLVDISIKGKSDKYLKSSNMIYHNYEAATDQSNLSFAFKNKDDASNLLDEIKENGDLISYEFKS
tara:strand:+ start:242 stop:856 length:615 start_codon:yes stop_codon:yes gene_type:complete